MSVVSKAKVIRLISYGDDVREFILELEDNEPFEAGQFLQLTLEEVTASQLWPESRTFSMASYTNPEKTIRHIIKREGNYTNRIFNELKIGSICYVKYAYGNFLLPVFDFEESIHCIAGGTGVAPFISFIEFLEKEGGIERLHLYYSARFNKEFVNLENLSQKVVKNNLNLYCTRETSDFAYNGHIKIENILANVKTIKEEHFYICGSLDFIKFFKQKLIENGAENIYTDEWE